MKNLLFSVVLLSIVMPVAGCIQEKEDARPLRKELEELKTERDLLLEEVDRLKAQIAELKTPLRKRDSLPVNQKKMMETMSWLAWQESLNKIQKEARFQGASIFLPDDMSEIVIIGTLAENSAKGSDDHNSFLEFLRMLVVVRRAVTPSWGDREMSEFLEYVSKAGVDRYSISTLTDDEIRVEAITTRVSTPPVRVITFSPE